MNIYVKYIAIKAYIAILLLILIPISAFSKSDFRIAYQIDDQIISNYDIDQARKLRILLSNSNISRSEVETIVINEKIKEIYANRIKITVLDTEIKSQLASFLKSNKMSVGELKSLMNSKGIDIETFYNFVKIMENTLPKDHPWNDLKLEFKENIKPKTILKNIKQESQDECC